MTLSSSLSNDRLLKVHVQGRTAPYLIQGTLLSKISRDFTRKVQHANQSNNDYIDLHNITQPLWETLMYWKFKGTPPDFNTPAEGRIAHFTECWIFGGAYGIADFQDTVMLELLQLLDGHTAPAEAKS